MSKYNPTKKRSNLVEVTEYAYGTAHGLGGMPDLVPIGKIWVKKGTTPRVRNLRLERDRAQKELADEMLKHLGIKK